MANRDDVLSERLRLAGLLAGMCDLIMPACEIQDRVRMRGEFTAYEVEQIRRLDLRLGGLRLALGDALQNWQAEDCAAVLAGTVEYRRVPDGR